MSPPGTGKGAVREIKEWQAIMDHLRSLPVKNKGELPVIPVDERAAEVRAIKPVISEGKGNHGGLIGFWGTKAIQLPTNTKGENNENQRQETGRSRGL